MTIWVPEVNTVPTGAPDFAGRGAALSAARPVLTQVETPDEVIRLVRRTGQARFIGTPYLFSCG